MLPGRGRCAPGGLRAPHCTAGRGEPPLERGKSERSPPPALLKPLCAGEEVNLCFLPTVPAFLSDPTAAPRTCCSRRARSSRSGSKHPQLHSADTSRRPPSCCARATTHARPAPRPANSESTCRVLAAAPRGEDPSPGT